MITKKELNCLFEWAKKTEFPMKNTPTVGEYSNKQIYHCWIKAETVDKSRTKNVKYIKKNLIKDPEVIHIFNNSEILFTTFSIFESGTILNKHKDPDVYRCPYKRIQIPIEIPDKEKCFMIWNDKKVFWEEGVSQVYEVMDYFHEGANLSNSSMKFLMVDVKLDTIVECEHK